MSPANRRAIANARQIVLYSSRFHWSNALQDYIRIPLDKRNYDFNPQDLDNQIINGAKNLRHQANQDIYERCLSAELEFRTRNIRHVEPGVYYQFESETADESDKTLQVKFTQVQTRPRYPLSWFSQRNKSPVEIRIADLEQAAEFLDNREAELAHRYGSSVDRGNWVIRFHQLNYHNVLPGNIVELERAPILTIDGFVNIAGMVASGKSTLSILIAAYLIIKKCDRRITIIVGDTQSAIKLANQFNWWFHDDPEEDQPKAIPILGGSQRDKHLTSFTSSNDYIAYQSRGQPHWGERWLSVVCPLQARISSSDRKNILNGKPLKPGKEPCHSLRKAPRDRNKKARGESYFCPLFNRCPSKQVYRDMLQAQVWLTTPGAMAQGGMPYHYELLPIKMGELINEQSDIVVFDEVDAIIEWFDNTYAEQVTLTNGNDGVFDDIGIKTEQHAKRNRVPPRVQQRWNSAQRQGQNAITTTLTLLNRKYGHEILRDWTSRGYFTPHVLFFKLARRIAGLEEFNSYPRSEQQLRNEERVVQWIMRHFDSFLRTDPTRLRTNVSPPVTMLLDIIQRINSTGDSANDEDIYSACKSWITRFFPNTPRRLKRLALRLWIHKNRTSQQTISLQTIEYELDDIDTLALRLQFALTITLLDRHTKIVFYEWQNRPRNIKDASPHRRMPSAMLNILPLPVTGRQFGTYYSSNDNNTLTLFAYTNIGRRYVMDYHRLLTDFNGKRGANVLALSGTSYLPDSTTFHVGNPQGVLKPEETAQDAIEQSKFRFIPQFDSKDKPIRMSGNLGKGNKTRLRFGELAKSLATNNGNYQLIPELQELARLGESNPELWANRDRILVFANSYEQAEWVADEMRNCLHSMSHQIRHLVADNAEKQKKKKTGALRRADIEIFGRTGGKILIAPTSAIGRGFNILNSNGKAAFGAVYFLTRPYPHPNDTKAIAKEMNRRAYDWLEKENFVVWQQGDGIVNTAELLRKKANNYWRSTEQRSYYKTLQDDLDLCAAPRYDLAATTLGRIIQAVGRLIRGGVPFHGYFVDSAWADNSAKKLAAIRIGDDPNVIDNDTEETSLLVTTILRACDYAAQDNSVGNILYKPLADALENIEDLYF